MLRRRLSSRSRRSEYRLGRAPLNDRPNVAVIRVFLSGPKEESQHPSEFSSGDFRWILLNCRIWGCNPDTAQWLDLVVQFRGNLNGARLIRRVRLQRAANAAEVLIAGRRVRTGVAGMVKRVECIKA